MNRQVGYIVYAHLILAIVAVVSIFIKKIPAVVTEQNNEAWCGTVSQQSKLILTDKAQKGKTIFMSKCASCHNLFKDATGPSILGFEDRVSWKDRKNVYAWIRNPAAFMKNDLYTQELKSKYGTMMTAFPDLSNEEIDAVCDYINQTEQIRYSIPVAER